MAVFVGGTGSANQFDDYEEGSWTVGVAFGGGTTGLTLLVTELLLTLKLVDLLLLNLVFNFLAREVQQEL